MQIQHEHNSHDGEGSFIIEDNGKHAGEMRYELMDGNEMEIYHTEVSPELQGQHWGEKLVEAGVNYARQQHYKIIPSCQFARAVFARKKEYADVLA